MSKGDKIIKLTKEEDERWAKAVRPVLDEYVAAMKAKGLPGEESLTFCQEWLKKNPDPSPLRASQDRERPVHEMK